MVNSGSEVVIKSRDMNIGSRVLDLKSRGLSGRFPVGGGDSAES